MTNPEIIKKRRYGRTRIHYSNELIHDLNEFLTLNGLNPSKEDLFKIEIQKAKEIVTSLLHKGLAYPEEYMPRKLAMEYTNYLLREFDDINHQCYTNGDWDEYHIKSDGFGWNHMTNSTFDGGIIVTSDEINFCFWIEEED